MTQLGNGQMMLQQALTWLDAYARRQTPPRTVNSYLYGAGGAGYYGVNNEPSDKTDLDGYFAQGNYPASQAVIDMGVDAVWAANYGLKRIAYEGGPSLDNFTEGTARAVNADSRMQDMIVKTHDAWSGQGGDLLVYYAVAGPAQWEFTPDITVTDTPKLRAIDQLRTQPRAPVTIGAALPGTMVAADLTANMIRLGYGYLAPVDDLSCVAGNFDGQWLAFPGHAGAAFTGEVVVTGQTDGATALNVWINGVKKGQVTLLPGSHLTRSSVLSGVSIPAGLVSVRLEVVGAQFRLRSISVN